MTKETCCKKMKYHLEYNCDAHKDKFECPDSLLYASKENKTIGIIIHDGGTSFIKIKYCPWCGKKIKKDDKSL